MSKGWQRVVLACASVFILPVMAQAGGKIAFGAKGAFAISNHWSTKEKGDGYSVESSTKNGFSAGVSASLALTNIFKLQPELHYVKKGSKQTVTVPNFPYGDINVTYKLDYLEIPLLLNAYPFRLRKLKPHTSIGPYVAFLLSSKYDFENQFLPDFEKDIEGIKETDFGIVFGTGIDYYAGLVGFSFDYRYSMGFVDLTLPTGPGFPEIELRNNCHSFMLGIIF